MPGLPKGSLLSPSRVAGLNSFPPPLPSPRLPSPLQ